MLSPTTPPYRTVVEWFMFALLPAFAKVLKLNASATRDEDGLDTLPFDFNWTCEDDFGAACVSQAGTVLDVASFATDELLTLPKETLPAGETQQVLNTIGVLYTIGVVSIAGVLNTIDVLNIVGILNTIGLPRGVRCIASSTQYYRRT